MEKPKWAAQVFFDEFGAMYLGNIRLVSPTTDIPEGCLVFDTVYDLVVFNHELTK